MRLLLVLVLTAVGSAAMLAGAWLDSLGLMAVSAVAFITAAVVSDTLYRQTQES